MRNRVPKSPALFSRRALVTAGATTPLFPVGDAWIPPLSAFDLWWAERQRLEDALSAIVGDVEDEDAHLLTRCVEVETLIFNTRSSLRSAARVKARVLTLLMEQENHEWAPSMREISTFIDRAT